MTSHAEAQEPTHTFRWSTWVALATAFALASAGLATARAYNVYDEAWFLQVVNRVVSGETLYRDVYYSPLPLAVYLTALLAALTAVHAFVVDAVLVASATASCLLVAWGALRLGCARPAAAAAALVTLLVAPPHNTAPYGAVAATFAVASLAVLVGLAPVTPARAALVGLLVGLAFVSKQNVGALAAFAALVGVVVMGGRLRAVAAVVVTAAVTVFVVLLPVAVQGDLGALVETGFANKQTYLRTASISYLDSLGDAYDGIRLGRPIETPLAWTWDSAAVLLPVVAAVALVLGLAFGGRRDRRGLVVAGVYGVAAFAGAYPRMDFVHLAAAAPCLVVVVAGAWAQLPRSIGHRADRVALVATAVIASAFVLTTIRSASYQTASSLPHLERVRLPPDWEGVGRLWRTALEPGSRVFVVRQEAGFAYLVSGAVNPTRFDYPASSNIGRAELDDIRGGVADGTIEKACIGGPAGFLEPVAVDTLIQRTMRVVRPTALCDLYRG